MSRYCRKCSDTGYYINMTPSGERVLRLCRKTCVVRAEALVLDLKEKAR